MFFYKKETPTKGNVLFEVFGCVREACVNKINNKNEKDKAWMDRAVGKYSQEFVDDVKKFLNAG